MDTQETLEAIVIGEVPYDEPKGRKGPLAGPIHQILQSQERMEANVARLTALMPKTPLARLCWRLKI